MDPITFDKSIKVTIEHGHDNHRCDDWSSTAYFYTSEPYQITSELPSREARLPLEEIK